MVIMSALCKVCGKPLNRGKIYCSHACRAAAQRQYKTCVVCGKRFWCPPSDLSVTCSPECSAEHRRQMESGAENTKAMIAAREEYVKAVAPENWQTAKFWVIRDPSGKTHECKNLRNFFREHQDLIDASPEAAAQGIVTIKRSMLGKRKKNPSYTWHGWTLLAWDDCGVTPRGEADAGRRRYGQTIKASFAERVKAELHVTTRQYDYFYSKADGGIYRTPISGGDAEPVFVAGQEDNNDKS